MAEPFASVSLETSQLYSTSLMGSRFWFEISTAIENGAPNCDPVIGSTPGLKMRGKTNMTVTKSTAIPSIGR